MLPDFVIIGAQKAGSTFVQWCLDDHPDVFVPWGETPFFEDPDYSHAGMPAFEREFDAGRDKQLRGMKRPNYLGKEEVPARVARHLPDARLIATLRDPVERAVSGYYHYMRGGWIPVCPLNEGMARLLDGAYATAYPRSHEIIEFGCYARHLRRWFQYYDRDRVLVTLFDEIRSAPEAMMTKVYRFLGLREDVRPDSLASRPMSSINSLVRLRFIQAAMPLYERRLHGGTRSTNRRGPVPALIRKAARGIDQHVLARLFKGQKPMLSEENRRRLVALYREDAVALRVEFGLGVDAWLGGAAAAEATTP